MDGRISGIKWARRSRAPVGIRNGAIGDKSTYRTNVLKFPGFAFVGGAIVYYFWFFS